jgi:hypothetical protein
VLYDLTPYGSPKVSCLGPLKANEESLLKQEKMCRRRDSLSERSEADEVPSFLSPRRFAKSVRLLGLYSSRLGGLNRRAARRIEGGDSPIARSTMAATAATARSTRPA